MKAEMNLEKRNNLIEVSICCATYNHEKYIEQTLQGFVNQITNFRFEVVIHEDASTDGTKAIIQKYVELYPDIFVPIYQTENQYSKGKGITTRNIFLKTRGKYVAMCEGDDYWCDNYKLQKQYDILENHTECSICVHRVQQIYEDGTIIPKTEEKIKYDLQFGEIEKEKIASALWLQGGYPFHTSTYFLRKEVIEDWVNGKAEFTKYMNGDLAMLRMSLMHGKFYFLNEVMSRRRRGVCGSWNSRWAIRKNKDSVNYYQCLLAGERMFDEYSNHQFHEYIQVYIFNLIAECCNYDTKNIKKLIVKNPLSFKIVQNRTMLRVYIRYLILRMSPSLYNLLFKIQSKLKK